MTEFTAEENKPDESAEVVDTTEQKIAELKQKLVEADDKYLRLYAEFDNFRRRSENDKAEFAKYANKTFIEGLLPVLDSFEHSKAAFEKQHSAEDLQKGFALIHKQFEDILAKNGIKKIVAKGQPFDPKLHEAVMQKPAEGVPTQTVLEELQPGYMIQDRLLRATMVVVSQ